MSKFHGIQALDSPSIDAFGRWRTSEPYTIFDSKQTFDNLPLFWDDSETSGGGTSSSHSVNEAATTISVGATTAGTRVRQTFQRFNYQPGKSQQILLTFSEFDTSTGIRKRSGYFDGSNGLFFESNEGVVSVIRRTNVTGSPTDNSVAQSNWNLDTMDGNGASGINLDFTKTQIAFIDFEWLGVGRVRMGWVVDGGIYYCHAFNNANNLTTVYMSTPNLPLRYEITNDGTGAADDFCHICCSVQSEGGQQPTGANKRVSTSGTHLDAASQNIIYALIGIRLKSSYIGATIELIDAVIQLQTGSHQVEWILLFNPTVAGTFTYSDITNSALSRALGATANTVTGGEEIGGGWAESGGNQAGNAGSSSGDISNALKLGSAIDNTLDTIVLAVRPVGGSTSVDIEGSLIYRELI